MDSLFKIVTGSPVIFFFAIPIILAMLYSLVYHIEYYSSFDINVFDFVSPKDLILLGLVKFQYGMGIIFVCAIPFFMGYIFVEIGEPRGGAISFIFGFLLFFILPARTIVRYAQYNADFQKTGKLEVSLFSRLFGFKKELTTQRTLTVNVCFEDGASNENVVLIGSTAAYMFFWQKEERYIHILKRDHIASMNTSRPGKDKGG